MTIKEMHYDFKQKLNKIDSQKYRNLLVPEIDWKLNEAQEVFVKMVAEPMVAREMGFEIGQRTIDDISTIVVDQKFVDGIVPTVYDANDSSYKADLPTSYWFRVGIKIFATKNTCINVLLDRSKLVKHNDKSESSVFDKSSFEWRTCNYRFIKEGLRLFTDGTFTPTKVCYEYLKKPRMVWNAQDFEGGTYDTLDGITLNGTQDSELPTGVHRDIVDLAVLITAGDLNLPDYMIKQRKVQLTK